MKISRLTLSPALALLIASCASRTPSSPAAPRIEMPAEARQACGLYVLPAKPSLADIQVGYATRGAQIVACDIARALAVQTHDAEHALEDRASGAVRPAAGPAAPGSRTGP
jgi:hypothetical protein